LSNKPPSSKLISKALPTRGGITYLEDDIKEIHADMVKLEARLTRVEKLPEKWRNADYREWCSNYTISREYADQLEEALK
jgi:hypothetical protein